MRTITVAIPVLNEEEVLRELVTRILAAVTEAKLPVSELLFIDDGSTDRSLQILQDMQNAESRIRVLSLSRNFGHQIAISAAIDHARGDAIILMDADLQDPPEVLRAMYKKWEEGYDIVYAVRSARKNESVFKRATASLFYRVLRIFAEIDIPVDAGDFCLLDRKVMNVLRNMPERSRYLRGLRAWIGFKSYALHYTREERFAGKTKYPLRKMMALAVNGILGFSIAPLRLATYVGITVSFASIAVGTLLVILKISFGSSFADPGWTSLILAIFFMGGMQLFVVGVIGEYLGRIYREVQGRPLYIVKEVFESTGS